MIDIVKYYKSLPHSRNGAKMQFREKVMARCGMTYPLFMNRITSVRLKSYHNESCIV